MKTDNMEVSNIESRIDELEIQLQKPDVLYHDHADKVEELVDLNAAYRRITGNWYSSNMEYRK